MQMMKKERQNAQQCLTELPRSRSPSPEGGSGRASPSDLDECEIIDEKLDKRLKEELEKNLPKSITGLSPSILYASFPLMSCHAKCV